MKLNNVLLMLVCFAMLPSFAFAGEISTGIGSCEVGGGIFGCEWKPSHCYKPMAPSITVYDKYSAKMAISEYNSYLSEVDRYNACMVGEAKSDIKKMADDIASSAKKRSAEIDTEVASVKSQLEMSLHLFRR